MSEDQADYKTEADEALQMLGKGYDKPSVILEPPRTYTARHNGKMVEVEEPAWVKFSTEFKKELKTLDEYSLKVFLYIGLSINWQTGEAYPGTRNISEETGMSPNTVTKAIKTLEDLGFLRVFRRTGASSVYKTARYISIGTVAPDDTVPSHGTAQPSQIEGEPSYDHRVNLHNKNNKKEQDVPSSIHTASFDLGKAGIDWTIAAGEEVKQEQIDLNVLTKVAQDSFESELHFMSLPWASTKEWEKFLKFVVTEYAKDPQIWRKYQTWRVGDGKYQGTLSNNKIAQKPLLFVSADFPTFMAHTGMNQKKKSRFETIT